MSQSPEPAELTAALSAGTGDADDDTHDADTGDIGHDDTHDADTGDVGPDQEPPADEADPPPDHESAATLRPEPTPARLAVAIVSGAAVAALGGWILGEYPFTGVMPYITGVLFALVVSEVILSASRRDPSWVVAGAAAVVSAAGIGLAVWIQSTEGLVAVPPGGWVAIGLGFVVALVRGGFRRRGRPRASSPGSS